MMAKHVDTPTALRGRAASIRWAAETERYSQNADGLLKLAEHLEAQAFKLEMLHMPLAAE
jgi:hypothetical protein